MGTKFKTVVNEITKSNINESDYTIVHYISTNTVDRYNEVMNPAGMDANNYQKNPVVLFAHNSYSFPIAKNLWLKTDDKGVLAKTQFDKNSEVAREVFRLFNEGFLSTWSIGYIPKENPKLIGDVVYIDKWELLEYSAVPVPANPDALGLSLKNVNNEIVKEAIMNTKEFQIKQLSELERNEKEIETLEKSLIAIMDKNELDKNEIDKKLNELENKIAIKLKEIINKIKNN